MTGIAGFSQSPVTHTDVTMRYDASATKDATLRAPSTCQGQSPSTPCAILPALVPGYDGPTGNGTPNGIAAF